MKERHLIMTFWYPFLFCEIVSTSNKSGATVLIPTNDVQRASSGNDLFEAVCGLICWPPSDLRSSISVPYNIYEEPGRRSLVNELRLLGIIKKDVAKNRRQPVRAFAYLRKSPGSHESTSVSFAIEHPLDTMKLHIERSKGIGSAACAPQRLKAWISGFARWRLGEEDRTAYEPSELPEF